jgi:hypothetical protein
MTPERIMYNGKLSLPPFQKLTLCIVRSRVQESIENKGSRASISPIPILFIAKPTQYKYKSLLRIWSSVY